MGTSSLRCAGTLCDMGPGLRYHSGRRAGWTGSGVPDADTMAHQSVLRLYCSWSILLVGTRRSLRFKRGRFGCVWRLMTRHTTLTHRAMNLNQRRNKRWCQLAPLSIKYAGVKGGAWSLVAGGLLGRPPQDRQPEIHIRCQDGPSNLVRCNAGDTCVITTLKGSIHV